MDDTTDKLPTTQSSDSGPGKRLHWRQEARAISSVTASVVPTLGLLSLQLDKRRKTVFTYDAAVMERRQSNVRANNASEVQDTSNDE